jgi:hypothetical protein
MEQARDVNSDLGEVSAVLDKAVMLFPNLPSESKYEHASQNDD